jgi:peptidylprolyl isomerase
LKIIFAAILLLGISVASTAQQTTGTVASASSTSSTNTAATEPKATGTSITLPSGVSYRDIVIGTGPEVTSTSKVLAHYTGTLKNGHVFDSSRTRLLPVPFSFKIGETPVVAGWDPGVLGMREGGRRLIHIPARLGYGNKVRPGIPPGSDLFFDIEVLKVDPGN